MKTLARIIYRLKRALSNITPLGTVAAVYLVWREWDFVTQCWTFVVVIFVFSVAYYFDKKYSVTTEAELSLRDNPVWMRLEKKIDNIEKLLNRIA